MLWSVGLSLAATAAGWGLFFYYGHGFALLMLLLWPSLVTPDNLSLVAQIAFCFALQFTVIWVVVYAGMWLRAHRQARSNSAAERDAFRSALNAPTPSAPRRER
jgi:hypothetical protein